VVANYAVLIRTQLTIGILLMAHSAQFFTLDEVNPCLSTGTDNTDAAQRLISARQCRRLLSRYRESGRLVWLTAVKTSNNSCLMVLHSMRSI
jgi:hypothetical protein